jgi:glycosyltransferase involved in cell wall biosynthesis
MLPWPPVTGPKPDSRVPAKLLIVTPTLGKSEYLEEAVRSVTNLPFSVRHVMAVPEEMVAMIQERFPHASVTKDAGPEGGIYGAINAGIRAAPPDWDWFTYINDDDVLAPGFSRMVIEHTARVDAEPVTYGQVRLIGERGDTISFLTTERTPRFIPALLHAEISPLNQQGMLFRRDVVEALKQFDTRYRLCADLDFWARAMAAGFPFRYYPLEVGHFRIRRGQLSGDVSVTLGEQNEIVQRAFPKMSKTLQLLAKWRYRVMNVPCYVRRARKVGWMSSYRLLATGAGQS